MKKFKQIVLLIGLSIIVSIILLQVISKKMNNVIYKYSNLEAKRFGIYIINNSLDSRFIKKISNSIFTVTKNSNNEIQMIDFKTKETNEILENITKRIQHNLIDIENGKTKINLADTFKGLRYKNIKHGIVCELPTGILLSNALVSNIGPVVPIKLNFIGDVIVNLNTHAHTYGINTVYIEVNVHIELEELISMPMQTKKATIKTDVPIAIKVIQGKVPTYYQPEFQRQSELFSLPLN